MKAMVFEAPGQPLLLTETDCAEPGPGEVLVRVAACAVCRTDLHIIDGDLDQPQLPLVPGHEIVGRIEELGAGVEGLAIGQRVGIPWLGGTCGSCFHCLAERENLCENAVFTGYTRNGGFAEFAVAEAHYCFPMPEGLSDVEAAPLLCAGLIGYRSLVMAGDAKKLGIYGFGAAAHIIAQVAQYQGREFYAFTRPGDGRAQDFARSLGACWAASSEELPDTELDAALIFAPVGPLVPQALRAVRPGGTVVCGGIHMSEIPAFPYERLWGERTIRSVANLTRRDGNEFLELAARAGVKTRTRAFPLEQANEALACLREGRLDGAAVLVP